LKAVLEAHASLPPDLRRAHPLAITGSNGVANGRASVNALGRVSDAQLGALYRECAVFCFPSFDEGFGLPVAEAMAAGAAVLTTPRGGLPEVAGNAAVYADPESPAAIAGALESLLRDPARRARLGAQGRERAAGLTWDRTAGLILGALETASITRRDGN
jgi:glycosyltransferase involved in cell wall biosynthesis